MLKARKGNRVIKIPDEKKKEYIALGYTITDMKGNVIHEHVEPTEKLKQLEKENEDLRAECEILKAENEKLKAVGNDQSAGDAKQPADEKESTAKKTTAKKTTTKKADEAGSDAKE